jgi:hypothetical protein
MGNSRFARFLQGGGVHVWSGTVSIVNSQIYSNTATWQGYVRAADLQFSQRPNGKLTFCSLLAGRRCLCQFRRHSDHLIVHHQWEYSFLCARALILKSSQCPDGKIADALALILACATAYDASVNYRGCVLQRT